MSSKTKVLVYSITMESELMNNYKFRYSTTQLENVPFYKYLGLILSAYENLKVASQELNEENSPQSFISV